MTVSVAYVNRMKTNLNQTVYHVLSDTAELAPPLSLSGAPCMEAWEQITWTGQVTAGFRTTFTCSSSCFPSCIYTWSFLGRTVNGSTLSWTPDGRDSTVELQCNVLNPETGVSSTLTSIVEIKSKYSRFISVPVVQRWNVIKLLYLCISINATSYLHPTVFI